MTSSCSGGDWAITRVNREAASRMSEQVQGAARAR